ncbi:hypothetical protein SAMN05192553_105169 [Cyclobacterium xiamenense]|uniref:Tetratricopeptide repeat-containing protein n=1 Tax=Cyclobacterium xiamenense TaxID=1297121 RepID=A0A1H6ZV57_9BACT|nr:hypothetical protein [Cyclobacterium xiamenense]SEJ57363.1 hypothetical protein SAMN05192553_105169 [Cyclobacterium xiamenense]
MIVAKKISTALGLLAVLFLCSCNKRQVIKKAENQKIFIAPKVLERLGDSVRFSIRVELPNALLSRSERFALTPRFSFGGEVLRFEKKLEVSGDTLDPYAPVILEGDFSMPFSKGMEKGELLAITEFRKGRNPVPVLTTEELLARGIVTTASLAQIGQYRGQEKIPVLGTWLPPDSLEKAGMGLRGWQEMEDRLSAYSNLPFTEKTPFLEVLRGPGDWSYKKWKMTGLPHYPEINRQVLLRFEREIRRQPEPPLSVSDMQLSILARGIRQGRVPADTLSERELAHAVSREPGWNEQEQLLLAMEQVYPSAWVYSNLGMVFLNRAQRTQSVQERNQLLENALFSLNRSNAFFENPTAVYNLGLVFWLWGDKFSAYTNFYRALALTQSDAQRETYEGALGAVSIFNGDYRLAAIHLNKAAQDPINLFNQGLANFLAKDYYNATIKFEESAIQNRTTGYPFYGLALIAARNGEEAKLYENLGKALERNDFLKNRAPSDREFFQYHEREGFKELLRAANGQEQ